MPDSKSRVWLWYAIATTVLWGFWGAFTGLSAQRGFPETLVYCVWALTMIPPAVFALARTGWKFERDSRSLFYGLAIGFLGAGGQMILFYTVTKGPAYLIFPVISLSPVITIALSCLLLRERTTWIGVVGIVLALIALPLFDFSPEGMFAGGAIAWLLPSLIVMACWGVQAYFIKIANRSMGAESIFFYMMLTGLALGPIAWAMTDFSQPINWGLDGPWLAAVIQLLNAVGALLLVYAFRYGKALVVSPLTNAGAPLMTAVISLLVIGVVPGNLKFVALGLALVAALLLSMADEVAGEPASQR